MLKLRESVSNRQAMAVLINASHCQAEGSETNGKRIGSDLTTFKRLE
jgi:hypothetical protein